MTADQRTSLPWIVGGFLATTLAVWTVLGEELLASAYVSRPAWIAIVSAIGGTPPTADAPDYADPPMLSVGFAVGLVLAAAAAILRWRGKSWDDAARLVGQCAIVPGAWLVAYYACLISSWTSGYAVIVGSVDLFFAASIACWLAAVIGTRGDPSVAVEHDVSPKLAWTVVAALVVAYVVPFVWMNWGQYWNLRTPHGDTAMYEEHLWNVLHGKGFRSYLDQGLFLGEHIQVVHLLLIPIYVLYPSHLTMELCESVALASTAIPAYLIASRHANSRRVGLWIAAAVLLYFPLHYLDIEIDRKSFRPICFGVPAMLWAFHFVELKRWRAFAIASVIALMAKEDYTLIIGPLGLWVAWTNWQESETTSASC